MIKKEILCSMALVVLLNSGCMQNGAYNQGAAVPTQTSTQSVSSYPATPTTTSYPSNVPTTIGRPVGSSTYPSSVATTASSTTSVKSALAYMYDEERLAKELYLAINEKQPVKQLSKIASRAEGRHIDAVNSLARKYGVATPPQITGRYAHSEIQNLFNRLYSKGIRSQRDALEVGCMVEVVDVNDLNRYINEAQQANAQDVVQTFDFLRKGSYNHYWAFDRGLKQLGVSSGCCSLGQEYCHPEYPKKSGGQGHGRGMGRGWR